VLLSKNGLPVLPEKKLSPEVLAVIRERDEEAKKVEKPENMAEEILKTKEENERKILKE
jgi:hypothetical protein